ncbi:hypothetical protein [Actinoplanes sp. NPDC049118]|uniref:hypothetical protein n=1 Tax=Actinoplanes sp. NPDC049118 TaxID=3155769 RepID=UPI0033DEF843
MATPSNAPGQSALAPAGTGAGTKPVVVTVCLVAALLTGLCLATVNQLDRSVPAQVLAVGAVVTALVAVLVALGGQLSTLLVGPASTAASELRAGRRGVMAVMLAGLLSMLAVLLAGGATLLVMGTGGTLAGSTEPMVVVQRSIVSPVSTTITAELTFPDLEAGAVLDATMETVSDDGSRFVLARSAVRVGVNGPATVRLTASLNAADDVVIEANAPKTRCTARLPSSVSSEEPAELLTCTTV